MTPSQLLDAVAAAFGQLLRRAGVATSPAEVIEVRRVLGLLGAADREALRAALRATCAKYGREQRGFDRAFEAMFGDAVPAHHEHEAGPSRAHTGSGLPDQLDIDEDAEVGRYAEYNERAAEVGEHFDTPEADKGFNPHKDDDDYSVTGADDHLSVSAEADEGRRGMRYTVEVDRAAAAVAGDLADSVAPVVAGSLSFDDPDSILAWLDAYDPSRTYGGEAGEPLTAEQLSQLTQAVEGFVAALAERSGLTATADTPDTAADTGLAADIDLACHEVLRRMRGAPRPRPRERGRGRLDMRRTSRAALRTDGVPFHLVMRTPLPDRLRLLVIADVSLSVRPVTAFTLRLAQALHRRAHRCRVMAFVDRPVDVTEILLRAGGDDALAAVLAEGQLDLQASSDYGQVFGEMLRGQADALDSRTAVLIVGDGRSGGLPPGVDRLRALRRRVHRLAWVTPEPHRYWRQATCAMPDYAQVCDKVVVAGDADALLARAAELAHALS
ncbi:VWA domain-containing protein [Mycolicibacterium cosmeticum]|uniref:VWA containing CoxE family protein n=1 Tax=Mycolicibacterium cosmeticum TaxID=258533 RepID=W9BLR8_MYCCO|nr:VWA domain-containing protein [Mycolicibacterium cosmeticum]TLH81703.1 VWA domain-containing protein [Mycolicibacterium cosmeticum]CDO10125.1 VWA containing CoxE family protein [Mycolicibacterium cosmeticum]